MYGEKNPNHMEEDCLNEIKCPNCQQDYPAYLSSCEIHKKEKKILEVKHRRKQGK